MTFLLYIILKTMTMAVYILPYVIIYLAAYESPMFRVITTPILIICLLAGPFRPYSSRVLFCMKVKRICRRAKHKCKMRHNSLSPFFFKTNGFDMEISDRHGVVYSIKFFKGNVNEKGIHLRPEGRAEIVYYLVAPRIGKRHAMGRAERTERRRKYISYEMPVAKYGESIMLFSPSPYQMTMLRENKVLPTGNGETYEGFRIYTARGFMGFIKRTLL